MNKHVLIKGGSHPLQVDFVDIGIDNLMMVFGVTAVDRYVDVTLSKANAREYYSMLVESGWRKPVRGRRIASELAMWKWIQNRRSI